MLLKKMKGFSFKKEVSLPKRATALVLSALLVATSFTGARTASATPSVEAAKVELNRLYDEAEQASERLNNTAVQLNDTKAKIDAANAAIAESEQVIAQKQEELAASQKVLAESTRNDYKSGGIDLLPSSSPRQASKTSFPSFTTRTWSLLPTRRPSTTLATFKTS